MTRYQNQTPRVAFAIAATVMSLATFTAFVGAPMERDAVDDSTVMARAGGTSPVVDLGRIEVVGTREAALTIADASPARAAR